ncbi:MAG: alpha/beta fold hydrolase [Acidimicrobiia bacterium]|nr:alpha/beta fold hydrolase [Acidimicrobiia bacterium]
METLAFENGMVNVRRFGAGPAPIVALHGFSQHGGSFEELATFVGPLIAPDLPGHGLTIADPVSLSAAESAIAAVIEATGSPKLVVGYSQGGRVALHLALTRPELISRLVLVSTSPGVADRDEREARRLADDELAALIERVGLATFLTEWLDLPMFAGLRRRSTWWQELDRARRMENTAAGLAAALRGMGQGVQDYVGEAIAGIELPVLFIAGENDARYCEAANRMAATVQDGRFEVIAGAGHSLIGEVPAAVGALVRKFLRNPPGPV